MEHAPRSSHARSLAGRSCTPSPTLSFHSDWSDDVPAIKSIPPSPLV